MALQIILSKLYAKIRSRKELQEQMKLKFLDFNVIRNHDEDVAEE